MRLLGIFLFLAISGVTNGAVVIQVDHSNLISYEPNTNIDGDEIISLNINYFSPIRKIESILFVSQFSSGEERQRKTSDYILYLNSIKSDQIVIQNGVCGKRILVFTLRDENSVMPLSLAFGLVAVKCPK